MPLITATPPHAKRGFWQAGSVAVSLAAAAVVAGYWWKAGSRVAEHAGCGADGFFYCRMARGQVAEQPYASRPLTPWLAGHLATQLPLLDRFLLVDFVALAAGALALVLLVREVAKQAGVPSWPAEAVVVCLWLMTPFGLRWALYYPANADLVPAALLFWWLLLTLRESRLSWVLVPLAVLGRPETALAVGLTALMLRRRDSLVAAVLGAATYAIDLFLPAASGGFSPIVKLQWYEVNLVDPLMIPRDVFFSAALLPLLALRRPWRLAAPILAVAAVGLLSAAGAAQDGPRVLTPAAVLVLAAGLPMAFRRDTRWTLAAVAGVLAMWEIWWPLSATVPDIFLGAAGYPWPVLGLRLAADVGLFVMGADAALLVHAIFIAIRGTRLQPSPSAHYRGQAAGPPPGIPGG